MINSNLFFSFEEFTKISRNEILSQNFDEKKKNEIIDDEKQRTNFSVVSLMKKTVIFSFEEYRTILFLLEDIRRHKTTSKELFHSLKIKTLDKFITNEWIIDDLIPSNGFFSTIQ